MIEDDKSTLLNLSSLEMSDNEAHLIDLHQCYCTK